MPVASSSPSPLRDQLGLSAGDTLELESEGERITLRPVRPGGMLTIEQGMWVFRTGTPFPAKLVDDVLEQIREERFRESLGESE